MCDGTKDSRARRGRWLATGGFEGATASRRTFLVGSGAVLGASLIAARASGVAVADEGLAHDHPEPSLPIWAATKHAGRYLALAGSADAPEIRELTLGSDGAAALGGLAGVALPPTLTALALHSTGGRLLVAGAEPHQTAGFSSLRPAMYDVTGVAVSELPLATSVAAPFSVATAIASVDARRIAVLVEGSDDAEQQYNAVARVASSADGGHAWSVDTLAEDLGEGHWGRIVTVGEQFFVVTVAGDGRRQGHVGVSAAWRSVSTDVAAGPVLALTSANADAVELIDRSPDGRLRRFQSRLSAMNWRAAGAVEVGQPALAAVAVSGARGEFVAIGGSSAHLVGRA